jgi:hypothetical protein
MQGRTHRCEMTEEDRVKAAIRELLHSPLNPLSFEGRLKGAFIPKSFSRRVPSSKQSKKRSGHTGS